MRGLSRLVSPVGRVWTDEQGATLALVAMLLLAMLGLVALVVDLGRMRLVRQGLVPAADAAALAAAQDLADRPWDHSGACATAGAYVMANAPVSEVVDCTVAPSGLGGSVTVAASQDLSTSFVTEPNGVEATVASSTAIWGAPSSVDGLRPIGFCYDGSSFLQDLIDHPRSWITYIEVPFTPESSTACGGWALGGNFTSLDFESGSDLGLVSQWTTSGYPEGVAFGALGASDCDDDEDCLDRSFPLPDLAAAMASLVASADYVTFPIFDHGDSEQVHVVGLLRARLYDVHLEGPPQYWRLDLKVRPGLVTGTCCGSPGLSAGSRVVAICGVDGTVGAVCQEGAS